MEARLRQLEGKQLAGEAAKPRGLPGAEKYEGARQGGAGALLGQAKAYDAGADVAMADGEKKEEKKKKKKVGGAAVLFRTSAPSGAHAAAGRTCLLHRLLPAWLAEGQGGSGSGGQASSKRRGKEEEGGCRGRGLCNGCCSLEADQVTRPAHQSPHPQKKKREAEEEPAAADGEKKKKKKKKDKDA